LRETPPSIEFPTNNEEHARQILVEARRLANLAPGEWRLWVDRGADGLGVPRADFRKLVEATVKNNEREASERKAEERRQEKRIEKQRTEERKRERDQQRIDKEAARTRKEKEKAFATLMRLPGDQHEARLVELARRLGEDPAALREEFEAFSGGGVTFGDLLIRPAAPATWNVVPSEEPVDVAALLQEVSGKISKFVVLARDRLLACVLWVTMSWIHEEVASHSPILDVFSVDEASGKTELMGVLGLLTPKPCLGAEFTAANIYRTVDADKPTLIIDEADDVFQRKPDLKHIVNNSWTRGFKIPRQVRIEGELQTYWFDPFCPKVLGHVLSAGKPLPRTLASRGIPIKIWPKRPDEHVEEFLHRDDNEFATLRRKLLRFANDQAKVIAEITPTFPAGFNNIVRANWKLLLAIAELAGGDWPERARKAAEFIAGKTEGGQGTRLFRAFYSMCVERIKGGATEIVIPSEGAVAFLKSHDPYWANDYRGSDGRAGEITQHKLAALLHSYEIRTAIVHPTRRENMTRGGYVILQRGNWDPQWIDMLARYCPGLSNIQTLTRPDRLDRKRRKWRGAHHGR
jgi:hypothetical protein